MRVTEKTLKPKEPCSLVIFGVTGNLAERKLLPALHHLDRQNLLPDHFDCIGYARREKTDDEFRNEMLEAIKTHTHGAQEIEDRWAHFSENLYYHQGQFDDDQAYLALRKKLEHLEKKSSKTQNRIFYLSTPPSFFPLIAKKLEEHGLIYSTPLSEGPFSRIIIEKPFGHDLDSALKLQHEINLRLAESQVYRIDHWLGKETVQNLLVFRFANHIFESLWNSTHIDNIQITIAEDVGIGSRGNFFEEAGMLRDIVQNHAMQLLSLVAMEPPVSLSADDVRNEKVKVLKAIRPFSEEDCEKHVVRGQYSSGTLPGKQHPHLGYREEKHVDPNSSVETFVAMKLMIDNWRWSGVPFYLRAGKRMPKHVTEIAITFKKVPEILFRREAPHICTNVLLIRIQPDEGISLRMSTKLPDLNNEIGCVNMGFDYRSSFNNKTPEAYERLLCDCFSGDSTLFARDDEVITSWKLLDPILKYWKSTPPKNFPNYPGGTWGPKEATDLIMQGGHEWYTQ